MKNKNIRKKMQKKISDQLHTSLSTLKEQLGEKKFEKRIKKVAKMLVSGIKKTSEPKLVDSTKKSPKTKKETVKISATD